MVRCLNKGAKKSILHVIASNKREISLPSKLYLDTLNKLNWRKTFDK